MSQSASSTPLRVDRSATHWTLHLDRPHALNALDAELVEALLQAYGQAIDSEVPVVALQGSGRCFSAGFDLGGLQACSDGDLLLRFVRIETLLQTIASAPCLSVAFAHGRNFGAAVDLVAACDLRVAAPDASFRMPGLQFGVVLGSARFARIVGTRQAQRLLETSATFDAQQALANGFVEQLAPQQQWPEVLRQAVARADALPRPSRRLLRQALQAGNGDAELAALVRSAAEPGLRDRMQQYLRATAAAARPKMPDRDSA